VGKISTLREEDLKGEAHLNTNKMNLVEKGYYISLETCLSKFINVYYNLLWQGVRLSRPLILAGPKFWNSMGAATYPLVARPAR
jgi:hypothetical protein